MISEANASQIDKISESLFLQAYTELLWLPLEYLIL